MLRYFSYIGYYCNDRFSTSVFPARDALKMAMPTILQKFFDKRTLPATKIVQTKISSFLKPRKEKENNNKVIYIGGKCLRFCVCKN